MAFTWGQTSLKRAEGVNDLLFQCATIALAKCRRYDQSVQWRGGVRTAEQQNEIYNRGASSKDGYDKKSYHQFGLAIDIAPSGISMEVLDKIVKGEIAPHPGFQEFAANMFEAWQELTKDGVTVPENYFLEWGGHWQNFRDYPHWQINILT